ncbi:tetratricopeptide repeat protein [Dolichospermum lemmermannii CS-548]|uniref:tetratricopeptide repeat protein n=1 Tax=Dolichospermum lemmermannii TaxID=54295 RepID=UPI002330C0D2|nr:tetratricopeptide repeat protein [Dolichospermum lemmermannii]MDB9439054.1 tetratricopeptide repeat protein [Dolichospermum lemmermannii CS-548]
MLSDDSNYILTEADKEELEKLVSVLELSDGTTIIFAITPESSPQHLVVKQLKEDLANSEENFSFHNFFYSENSFHNFLYSLDENVQPERKLIMAFGLDQLPTDRLVREMQRLNLGREELFGRNLILIFWLNQINFLDEFRQRAPDFWDWREKVVQFETRNPLLYIYLEWLIAENSYLKMSGVMQVNRQVDIFLDQIYVSLQAQRRQEIIDTSETREIEAVTVLKSPSNFSRGKGTGIDFDDRDETEYYQPVREKITSISSTKTITEKVELSQAVRQNAYSVILGAPGAGKTTLLRYLALHFATAKRDDQETVIGGEAKEDLGKTLLPIFFRIADYAEKLKLQPNLTLTEYLRQFYRHWEAHFQTQGEMGTEVAAFLLDAMHQGKCLMLLDGLDEVFDQESRRQIVESINQFVNEFSHNKYVITSRIAGYRDVQLSSRFAEYMIEDMSSEKVEQFLYRWCRTVEKAQQPDANEEQIERKGNEQAANILNAIQENEGVKRLTANPLLLTILALIHRNGERLPNRRVRLYELAVQTLIEDWQLSKKLPDAPKVVLRETEVVELLAPLAYWMHEEKPSGLVTETEVQQQLATKMAELNDAEPESDLVRQAVGEFLRKVRETTGLFVERAPGVYGFMHLTFEEYFAARYIADNDQSKIQELIQQHLHEPRWNEPILLSLGYYGIHSPGQVKKLIDQLFSNLQDYQPALQHGEIKIKTSADNTIIIYLKAEDDSAEILKNIEFNLQDLFFAGQVIAEVEVSNIFRKNVIEKLVITYIGIDDDFDNDLIKQLLRTLRKIELFYQKGEVIAKLTEVANDVSLSPEMQIKAKTAILYVACGQSVGLDNYVTKIVNQLESSLFDSIRNLVKELGEEMTPNLEISRQFHNHDESYKMALIFITAMSYVRKENYDKAITIFEDIDQKSNNSLKSFIYWSLAICYEEKENYDKANEYYDKCKIADDNLSNTSFIFWRNWGWCQKSNSKHEQSLDYYQNALNIINKIQHFKYKASCLFSIGRVYQDWGKYEQAISYHEQSRELYQQLGKEKDVADLWYNLADCYREWGKYQQAVDCENQDLAIRQQLDDQDRIALAYFQLGTIYQGWGKYEQAITYYEKSLELYQQLGKEEILCNLWYLLAYCYKEWGKYQQAVDCENQDLAIHQQLDDQVNIARADNMLGRIYQGWGKYEQAISYHEQSRELYQQLGKDENVANLWYWLADCYREWGKYQQAVDCENQDLAIHQQLDDQVNIARANNMLGRIYQGWGKYEQAISYHEQSRELYQQLGKDENVADLWYWIADCYKELGKYQQAVDCENQDLAIRQQLDDQVNIADAYKQLGRIYQGWGKYEQAISYYEQSRELYQQLGKEKNAANQWYNLADCYREWGKYQQAVDCENQNLAIRQQLDDQVNIADAYFQLGRIYQGWGKYEQAINYHEQSRELYQQLGKEKDVADLWYNLAVCYREWGKYQQAVDCENQDLAIRQQLDDQVNIADAYRQLGRIYQGWGKYEQAINYHEQSRDIYQQLGKEKDVATRLRQIANCQVLLAKNTANTTEVTELLKQAEKNIHQAIEINTLGQYQENLVYDYTKLSLLYSAHLHLLPVDNSSIQEKIALFEESYHKGLTYFDELGQIVDKAEEALDIARVYLEVEVLENLNRSEEMAQECLQVFQDYNRQKLTASAYKLLGKIYLKRTQQNQPDNQVIAHQFLTQSLQIYQDLDLQEKAGEISMILDNV